MKKILTLEFNELVAFFLYFVGKCPKISTFVDGETMTFGYGKLDKLGIWQYQLPFWFSKKIRKMSFNANKIRNLRAQIANLEDEIRQLEYAESQLSPKQYHDVDWRGVYDGILGHIDAMNLGGHRNCYSDAYIFEQAMEAVYGPNWADKYNKLYEQ